MADWEDAPEPGKASGGGIAPVKAGAWEDAGAKVETSQTPAAPDSTKEPPTLLRQAIQPVLNIPGAIKSEFQQGSSEISDAYKQSTEAAKHGKEPGAFNSLRYLMGGMQEAFSPISGTVKALAADPVANQFPQGSMSQKLARETVQDVSMMVAPDFVAKSVGTIAKSMPGYSKAVKLLMDEGINMTPGQLLQSIAKSAEDSIRSVPAIGQVIAAGQAKSLRDFNRAVLNRGLKQIGETLPKDIEPGRDAITYAAAKIGEKYDALLPKLQWRATPELQRDVISLGTASRTMPQERVQQLKEVIRDASARLNAGRVNPYVYKEVESELNYLARSYIKAEDPDQQMLGHAIDRFNGYLKDNLARVNPAQGKELQKINSAWAAYKRAEGASIRRVSSNGVFSPADLLADIKRTSSQGVFAHGDGLLQDLADAGNAILPSKVPDSGTAQRVFWGELAAGAAGHKVGMTAEEIAGMAVGVLPYTPPGMWAVNKAARAAPKVSGAIREGLETGLPGTGPVAVGVEEGTKREQ